MAYHGYIPFMKTWLERLPNQPKVLEVGIDRGVTLIPLASHLARTTRFTYVGVDVLVQESLGLTLSMMDEAVRDGVKLYQANSLEILPKLAEVGHKFDLILLDGDHNYHTVSQELEMLEPMLLPHTIMIIDDYDGKWAERDLWYAEREGYENVDRVTQPVDTDKHGVAPAVNEWLGKHPEWLSQKLVQGEPILLTKTAIV